MHVWQLHDAKARLTQLITEAKREPQVISKHGKNVTVVIDYSTYQKLIGAKESLVSFLRRSPLCGLDLELTRDTSSFRDIEDL